MIFKYEVGDNIKNEKRDLTILNKSIIEDIYFNTRDNKQRISRKQFYEYKCNKCGYIGNIRQSDLNNNKGCSCCAGKIVVEGINDIPTTAPWMIPYFQGGYDEAKLYSYGSHTKIYPICPDCGKVKDKLTTINKIHRIHSIGCTCGDGISYPEKFFISLLNQLNINYIYQPSKINFKWINNNIRYDFYIPKINTICEINGLQHYKGNYEKLSGHDLEYEQNNDKFKKDLAIKNGIVNYIYIDCRKSELQWIKNSILESELLLLLNFKESDIDWIKCGEYACKNLVKEVCDYATENSKFKISQLSQIFKLHYSTIAYYLKEGNLLGWYKKPSKIIIKKELPIFKNVKSQPIMCINNGLIFLSMTDCSRQSFLVFGVSLCQSDISQICSGKIKHSKGYVFKEITKEKYVELLNKQKDKEDIMTAEQQRVINILAPLAVKYGAMHNVCSSLSIAQAILESGWLKSCIGGYACFGVKGKGLVTTTQEYINGKWITIQDSFEVYKSYEDSFKGYYAFLERYPRYKRYGVIGEWDYVKACKNIFRAGYATGKDYDLILINIIQQFKLYEYDKQALELREKLYKNINPTPQSTPSPTPKPIIQQPTQPIQSTTINKKITIANGQWNVRQQPNANATVIKIVNAGQVFTSSKVENGWYYVNELKGYINSKGISKAEDIKVIPSFITYKIKAGDSWWKIAQEQMGNGARCEELAKYNGMTTKTVIQPNQQIKIPK